MRLEAMNETFTERYMYNILMNVLPTFRTEYFLQDNQNKGSGPIFSSKTHIILHTLINC